MKLLLFGGTTEGREILKSGLPLIYSAATEYGAGLALDVSGGAEVLSGRMDVSAMEDFLVGRDIAGVIDATHPHAVEATKNIRLACERTGVPYVRVIRRSLDVEEEGITTVASCREAAGLLDAPRWRGSNALLTVGSKELAWFTKVGDYRKRLYVRVLPVGEVLWSCEKMGFDAGHLIAMQGPFSKAMNRAMLEMTGARVLVSKDSGAAGGLPEKLEAARECEADVILIRRPLETGMTVAEAIEWGYGLLKETLPEKAPLFPLFTDIRGRTAVVVGGGKVAARRARTLLECGARVRVVSPEFCAEFEELAVERAGRSYEEGDLRNAILAVAATDDRGVNRRAGAEARRENIPVSVADAPEECTFFFPALVSEGGIAAAVSTGGRSPALSRRLAGRLREVWAGWVLEEQQNVHEEGREKS